MVDKVLLCLSIVALLCNSSYSLIAPFYPLVVVERGINTIYIGFLMGIQAIFFTISSFFTGKYLKKIGRSRGMIIGILLVISGITGLGTLDFVYSKPVFIFFSFVFKVMCGIGAGLNSTSSMAIVASVYKNDREKALGKI